LPVPTPKLRSTGGNKQQQPFRSQYPAIVHLPSTYHIMLRSFAIISIIALLADRSCSFTLPPVSKSCVGGFRHGGLLASLEDAAAEGQQSPAQKKQETKMETASIAGADEIRKLTVPERTKRAMLAEAVEGTSSVFIQS